MDANRNNLNMLHLKGMKNVLEGRRLQKLALEKWDSFLLAEGKNMEILGKLQIDLSQTKEELQKIRRKK